jgi:predicted DNA binding CopG/RHH family protein
MMSKEPKIGKFLDDEERELHEAIEREDYGVAKSFLTSERKAELQGYARATINEKRVKVSLRVPETDLARLKARALREGVPYQTLINSILHKEAVG